MKPDEESVLSVDGQPAVLGLFLHGSRVALRQQWSTLWLLLLKTLNITWHPLTSLALGIRGLCWNLDGFQNQPIPGLVTGLVVRYWRMLDQLGWLWQLACCGRMEGEPCLTLERSNQSNWSSFSCGVGQFMESESQVARDPIPHSLPR